MRRPFSAADPGGDLPDSVLLEMAGDKLASLFVELGHALHKAAGQSDLALTLTTSRNYVAEQLGDIKRLVRQAEGLLVEWGATIDLEDVPADCDGINCPWEHRYGLPDQGDEIGGAA